MFAGFLVSHFSIQMENTEFQFLLQHGREHLDVSAMLSDGSIVLEGNDFYSGFINPNAIRGAMTSIALDYGISIIPTRTEEDTAAMIKRIAIREQKGEKRSIQIRTERKPQNLWEQQLFIIESLPNIGPVHAKRLLEHFGSVKAVLEADEKKLQEVEGIGKKTAKNIREVVEGKYLYFKKDDNQKKLK